MAEKREAIAKICHEIGHQVHEAYKGMTLHFVIHENGQFAETAALSFDDFAEHPAASIAERILERKFGDHVEESQFFGLAAVRYSTFFGFVKSESILGLFNINVDKHETPEDARRHIYNLVWHALDIAALRNNPEYKNKLQSGPMIPKRSPMNLAKANMQADAFSAIMGEFQGEKGSIDQIASQRAHESLIPIVGWKPQDYPYIIAMEATQFAFQEMATTGIPKQKFIPTARQLSLNIGKAFNEHNIEKWWAYCNPAQEMAWSGYSPEDILGSAISVRSDPFIRAMGQLVLEVCGISPTADSKLIKEYNTFVDPSKNEKLHKEIMESTFNNALTIGVELESAKPLRNAANLQNERLTEGKIIGWCAAALQAAAKGFENALANGNAPEHLARLEFEGSRNLTTWTAISKLGEEIIEQRRMGFAVTLGHIAEMCSEYRDLDKVLKSVLRTMDDPDYIHNLAPANDLALGARVQKDLNPTHGFELEFAPEEPGLNGSNPKFQRPSSAPTPSAAPSSPAPTPGLGSPQNVPPPQTSKTGSQEAESPTEEDNI